MPTFAIFKFPEYKLSPKTKNELGIFIIQGQLFSTEKIISFQIKVNVTNTAPFLTNGKILDMFIKVDSPTYQVYQLSDTTDREEQEVQISVKEAKMKTLPKFVKFDRTNKQLAFSPSKQDFLKQ